MPVFPDKNDFYPEVRRRVSDYFHDHGISRYANRLFWIKALVHITGIIGGYAILLTNGAVSSGWLWGGYLVYLMSAGLFVINVAHDASHHAVSRNRRVNKLLAYSWNLVGMSRRIWEAKHHESHHVHTNLPFLDVDIPENPFIRFNQAYRWRPWFRYQHLYTPILFFLFGPYQVFVKDFLLCFFERHRFRDLRLKESDFPIRMLITKMVFVGYGLLLPWHILNLPFVEIAAVYLASISITGFLIIVILAIPHMNESGAWLGPVPDVRFRDNWALLQVKTTVDSSPHSNFMAWMTGGLHTQIGRAHV